MSFNDKVVIITGGSSGIGEATAIQFVKESAKVAIVGRNESKLANVARKCEKLGNKPVIIRADLLKEEDTKTIVQKTVVHFGKLDILVNNAGVSTAEKSIKDKDILNTYDKVMTTNFRAVVQITSLAVPYLLETKGNIVNVSSVLSYLPNSELLIYSATKAALDAFSRNLSLDLAGDGIRVNVVNPGFVRTDILMNITGVDQATSDTFWDTIGDTTPLKGVSESDEIANIILYLTSDKAKTVTGNMFSVDRGTSLIGLGEFLWTQNLKSVQL